MPNVNRHFKVLKYDIQSLYDIYVIILALFLSVFRWVVINRQLSSFSMWYFTLAVTATWEPSIQISTYDVDAYTTKTWPLLIKEITLRW